MDYGAYAIRPYAFDREKERPSGFPVLGWEDERRMLLRPYAFDRKK